MLITTDSEEETLVIYTQATISFLSVITTDNKFSKDRNINLLPYFG